MDIPILKGIYISDNLDVRVAYPVNLEPVAKQENVAELYLRPSPGIVAFATGTGSDRGALVWNNVHYRVSGTSLITVSATGVVALASATPVAGVGPVRMVYGFDRMAIAANGTLYYWSGITLTTVTDPNIGVVNDMTWIDSYFAVTDGTNIVVTNLNDPTLVNALKYGTTDRPDPVECILNVKDELTVVSRHYIDFFKNVGGTGFPFDIIKEAVITKGAVGSRAACEFQDTVAFVGSGFKEENSVYLATNGQATRIATEEIDELLQEYTSADLATITMESVITKASALLYIHLPDRTLVYNATASAVLEEPVWFFRVSGLAGYVQYRARNFVLFNDKWIVGDPLSTSIGALSRDVSAHFGNDVRWEFSTRLLRNQGNGFIVNKLELLAITGQVAVGKTPRISVCFTDEGRTWSQKLSILSGKVGDSLIRLVWVKLGLCRNWRIFKFEGDSISRLSPMGLDADIEPLKW